MLPLLGFLQGHIQNILPINLEAVMTNFLMRIFLKNLDPEKDRSSAGKRSGAVGIGCNIVLFLAKLLAGTLADCGVLIGLANTVCKK